MNLCFVLAEDDPVVGIENENDTVAEVEAGIDGTPDAGQLRDKGCAEMTVPESCRLNVSVQGLANLVNRVFVRYPIPWR